MLTRALMAIAAVILLLTTASASADPRFPSTNPDPRVGTPDDPGFDCAEPDDEDPGAPNCSDVWEEQFNLFGFAPNSTLASAQYHDAPRAGQGQISGVSADLAWKKSIGQPSIDIAIVDTGIVWSDSELRLKIRLNPGELPLPQLADNSTSPAYDANGDGTFNVADYANDARVSPTAGPHGSSSIDGEDLIVTFSNSFDGDANGYDDDIAGWDFFDDDNDPYDASSYSSAEDHGSGRAKDAARETNNASGDAGVCPKCRIMPLRLWDSFVAPAETYAMATLYAADNGADVLEAALGVLQNSRFAQAATQYAFEKGVALMEVSSDLNTSDHNYPTNYNNTIFVAGTVADAHGLGQNNAQFGAFLQTFGIPAGSQVPVGTWFRNSGLTQYGGHAAIVMVGTTGSESTGQAAGAAGLIKSRALEVLGDPLTSNELKQIITLTAEDVLPENTGGAGTPDYSQIGWDQHFGYGRANLGAAVNMVTETTIPPEAGIESPPWFMPVDPVTNPTVPIGGFAAAKRAAASSYSYTLEYASGLEPLEETFTQFFASAPGLTTPLDGPLATLPLADVASLLPGAADGIPPIDPHQYAFTVRLRVTDDLGNVGEDRKVLFAYHDETLHAGWPKFVDTGGEQSLRFADLDGDGTLQIIAANTSGEINVYEHDGTPSVSFNGGSPFLAPIPAFIQNHMSAAAFVTGGVSPGRGGFSTPAVGDLDSDGQPEIVVANGDRVFALSGDGSVLPGFPVAINPAFSAPAVRTKNNHLKTAIFSSAVLGDLDGDGRLDIIVSAMDQRAYAWDMDGDLLPGWPVFLKDPACGPLPAPYLCAAGAESINTPAVADIDGDSSLEVIVATNEIYNADGTASVEDGIVALIGLLAGASGQVDPDTSRLYAIYHDGTAHDGISADDGGLVVDADAFLPGWPKVLTTLDGELLPLVEPGVDAVVADVDPLTPGLEVVNGAFAGDLLAIDEDGSSIYAFQSAAGGGGPCLCPGTIIQAAEHVAVGDVTGTGQLTLFKGGIPIEQLVNLLLVGQNVPYQNPIQGWNAATGAYLPGWPRPIDDYQLFLSPVIADVGGGPDREIIEGSGLYLLHAFEVSGVELPGFPKFTGGWISSTAPVGDLDGDGLLEIAMWTREGNMFVWDTDGPACGGNNEWWGFRHDEHNSGRYGNDTRPPRAITDLAANLNPAATEIMLSWSASGDDALCGPAIEYEMRRSGSPITPANFSSATLMSPPAPAAPGTTQNAAVPRTQGDQYFAIRAIDDVGNPGALSNVVFVQGPDSDGDGVNNIDETNCGGDPGNGSLRPERVDGPFAGVDDNGNTLVDEPLLAGSGNYDCDGDGYKGTTEDHVFNGAGGRDQDACGANGWPAELASGGVSANRITLTDLSSFVAPSRRLNTSSGDPLFNVRWDIVPGSPAPVIKHINLTDIANLVLTKPAMLGGVREFGGPGPNCPWPP